MIGFEILLNGRKLCLVGAGDGVLSATVVSVPKRAELALEVGGLLDDSHLKWAAPNSLAIGDEITVRIVETDSADPATSTQRDAPALVEASERAYYQRLKKKYDPQ